MRVLVAVLPVVALTIFETGSTIFFAFVVLWTQLNADWANKQWILN